MAFFVNNKVVAGRSRGGEAPASSVAALMMVIGIVIKKAVSAVFPLFY